MAELVCKLCSHKEPVPKVCCGTGVPGKDPSKLYCPAGENHGSQDIPRHCGQTMKIDK